MYQVKSTLPEPDRKVVAEALQGALVDLVDLSLVAKQLHWNVVGPRFRSVHRQLDEVVTSAREHTDEVAERCSTLGVPPDGRVGTVAADTSLTTVASGWQQDADVVRFMVDCLGTAVHRMRDRCAAVATPDPVTEDLLLGVTADLEEHHWMFQAQHQG